MVMTVSGLLVFATAYALAVASPGPGVAAIVARVLAAGLPGVGAFIAGFVVGDLMWFTMAAAGLAVVARNFAWVFVAIKWAGAAYLLYLGWQLWTASAKPVGEALDGPVEVDRLRLFWAGLSLTLGNPKVIVFFMALLPSIMDLGSLGLAGFVELAVLIAVILSAVLGTYALTASRARLLFRSERAVRLLNRATGTVMAGAAVAIVSR